MRTKNTQHHTTAAIWFRFATPKFLLHCVAQKLHIAANVIGNYPKITFSGGEMKKSIIGIGLGSIAGIIDVIPMVFMKLTWDANISAFLMWVIVGFFISISSLKINGIIKGLIIAFLVLLPSAILIGWNEPISLIPILIMTSILGSVLGFSLDRIYKKS